MNKAATSSHSPLTLNIRIAPTSNEKCLLLFALLSLISVPTLIITYNHPQYIGLLCEILLFISALYFFIWFFFFDFSLKKTKKEITPIRAEELFHRWNKFSYFEQLSLILTANLPLYRTLRVNTITRRCYHIIPLRILTKLLSTELDNEKNPLPHEHIYEIRRLYNCFTDINTIQKLLIKPNCYFNLHDIKQFETTSNIFNTPEVQETNIDQIKQLETKFEAELKAEREALKVSSEKSILGIANFMLKIVKDPSPIESVTVPTYIRKYHDFINSSDCPYSADEMPSQNFITKKLRKGLPRNFRNEAHKTQ